MFVFISGAVRSGKSSYAEARAIESISKQSGGQLYYVATSTVADHEMASRIKHHQQQREQAGVPWNVIEAQVDIGSLAANFDERDIVLIDCLTTLLNNELFRTLDAKEYSLAKEKERTVAKLSQELDLFLHGNWTTLLVSNEVGDDIPYEDEYTLAYQHALSLLHQKLVREGDEAVLVEHGIPLVKKGG
ncbi:bifunctional adenosylcobinamide kinase/adenosylcobinamide-phosphate guanylyltransferase [Halalkalibacterium halodurans]|uniref:bifunctional adenosylcobinamide kinase/adenosylcobinamide-phosphate guanylyltransferase n=1 Tax=Halalkalibacterium halodurans TaxID=86665 RepID=UPI00106783CA|nr:bifunctional adenosylcobinamide kinase/adenosylcobinamide-phosphate guanylyltransferase [Halalkalibacterium halodurans]MED3646772.1 bifunctional adenosylcobinamide kinase/adenosylcobinamide-phosphate guanylyltransferase [Halalkalibacterium halodurans]TES56345.1 bifunctional adenosylcobinamide kinase/adenosylcobinamide-phosphate guanylyltransferase [Halalkalibacterium halodurans]